MCAPPKVVSVRLGKRLAATEARFGSLQGRHARRLHIEDPFLLQRNLNCVLGRLQEPTARVCVHIHCVPQDLEKWWICG
eukprot:9497086-Pyramimonas_sp.AAC.1